MTAPVIRDYFARECESRGLRVGTHPENRAAVTLHRLGVEFVQQHRISRYRADFALPAHRLVIEVDGPHHQRPDVAHKDAIRDRVIRSQGWTVIRIDADDPDAINRVMALVSEPAA